MTIKEQLNTIKPETGENSKLLKTITEDMDSKLNKALANGKDYVYYSTSDIKLFKDVLSDIRVKMIYHIMLLQKCQDEPLKSQIKGSIEEQVNTLTEKNQKIEKKAILFAKTLALKIALDERDKARK